MDAKTRNPEKRIQSIAEIEKQFNEIFGDAISLPVSSAQEFKELLHETKTPYEIRQLKAEEEIYSQGRKTEFAYLLLKGVVHLTGGLTQSEIVYLGRASPEHNYLLGVESLFNKAYTATAHSTNEATVARMQISNLEDAVNTSSLVCKTILAMQTQARVENEQRLETTLRFTARSRLAKYLLQTVIENNSKDLIIQRANIKERTNLSREQVSRTLHEFYHKEIILLDDDFVTLKNVEGVFEMVNDSKYRK